MSESMNGLSGDWVEDLVIEWLCKWLSPSEVECRREFEREREREILCRNSAEISSGSKSLPKIFEFKYRYH